MSLDDEVAENTLLFKLTDKTPGNSLTVFIQTNNSEQKEQWTSQIRNMLDMQGNFLIGASDYVFTVCLALKYM